MTNTIPLTSPILVEDAVYMFRYLHADMLYQVHLEDAMVWLPWRPLLVLAVALGYPSYDVMKFVLPPLPSNPFQHFTSPHLENSSLPRPLPS